MPVEIPGAVDGLVDGPAGLADLLAGVVQRIEGA